MATPKVFSTLSADYERLEQIGQGGASHVFRVHNESGKEYALKYVDPRSSSTQSIRRFRNEIGYCRVDRHPSIIKVVDDGFVHAGNKKLPFYVMPYYPTTLRQLMEKGIKPDSAVKYFTQLCSALHVAHSDGVIHRDLKPENVLLNQSDDCVIIADFGIARLQENDMLTAVKTKKAERLANYAYAAPEQKLKDAKVDESADIWALGLILNEMFTGVIPAGSGFKSISDVADNWTFLDKLVNQMINQQTENRLRAMKDVQLQFSALQNILTHEQRSRTQRAALVQIPDPSIADDPLILQPIEVTGVDYHNHQLTCELSETVNQLWQDRFYNSGYDGAQLDVVPERWTLGGRAAKIGVQPSSAKHAVEFLRKHIDRTNGIYAVEAQRAAKIEQRNEVQAAEERVRQEEEHAKVLRDIHDAMKN